VLDATARIGVATAIPARERHHTGPVASKAGPRCPGLGWKQRTLPHLSCAGAFLLRS